MRYIIIYICICIESSNSDSSNLNPIMSVSSRMQDRLQESCCDNVELPAAAPATGQRHWSRKHSPSTLPQLSSTIILERLRIGQLKHTRTDLMFWKLFQNHTYWRLWFTLKTAINFLWTVSCIAVILFSESQLYYWHRRNTIYVREKTDLQSGAESKEEMLLLEKKFLRATVSYSHASTYSTILILQKKNKKAQLTQRERATAVHVWRPTANKCKIRKNRYFSAQGHSRSLLSVSLETRVWLPISD